MGNKTSKEKEETDKSNIVKPPLTVEEVKLERKHWRKQELLPIELTVHGYIRQCAGRRDMTIYGDIMTYCMEWYYPRHERSPFSKTYMSPTQFVLSDDRTHIKKRQGSVGYNRVADHSIGFFLADYSNLCRNGIHCWRVHVFIPNIAYNQENPYIFFGISTVERFINVLHNDGKGKIFGVMGGANMNYLGGSHCNYNIKGCVNNMFGIDRNSFGDDGDKKKIKTGIEYEVDILLNCDTNQLRLCVIGYLNDESEAVMWGLPNNTAWIPHFQTSVTGAQFKLSKIATDWYGIHKECVWTLETTADL